MNKISVKLKVTVWYTLVMIIVSSIVLIAMSSIGKDMIDREISKRLSKVVTDFSVQIIDHRSGKLRPVPDFMMYDQGVHLTVYNSEHTSILGQIPFGITVEPDFVDNEVRRKVYNGNEYYVFDREIKSRQLTGSLWVKGIVSVRDETYSLNSVIRNNLILTLILILVAAFGGYFIISRSFVPVKKISDTAKKISQSSDLSKRINIGDGKDEIHSLANTFDEMLEQIEQSFEKEKQFTSDASHELRTPIAVILSECEYALECANTTEELKDSILSIKRQTDKMSKLVSELLTISRMDKNTLRTNFEETDLSELLSFVCDEQEEIHQDNITLERDITPGITLRADRFLIARLFINLISNAYQYSKDEGNIKVSLTQNSTNIIFSVTDNGIGIKPEHLDRIWERFYQADAARTSNENGSMGLGLSMVKWIAECHNGKVSVESEYGIGSVFTLVLPHANQKPINRE